MKFIDNLPALIEEQIRELPPSSDSEGDDDTPVHLSLSAEEIVKSQEENFFRGPYLEEIIEDFISRRTLRIAIWVLSFTPFRLWREDGRYVLHLRSYTPATPPDIIAEYRADLTTAVRTGP